MITAEKLREILSYNPDTGIFHWKKRLSQRAKVGDVAGWDTRGYLGIRIYGKSYPAHRLAFLYVRGRWPAQRIDHINGNPSDNRISNLRECNHSQNVGNTGLWKHNTSGVKGVNWDAARKKWKVRVGRKIMVGRFDNLEEATMARAEAARKFFGEFARAY